MGEVAAYIRDHALVLGIIGLLAVVSLKLLWDLRPPRRPCRLSAWDFDPPEL